MTEHELSNNWTVEDKVNLLRHSGHQCYDDGEYHKAASFYIQAIDQIQLQPDVSTNQNRLQCDIYLDLADTYIQDGKYQAADKSIHETQEIAVRLNDCLRLAYCIDRQAKIKKLQGHHLQALNDFKKSMAMKLEIHGGDRNLDVAYSYNCIGIIHDDQFNYTDAKAMYEKALNIRKEILGDNHPDVAQCYWNLGLIYRYRANYPDALRMFHKALSIKMDIFGEHIDVANCYCNIALIHHHQRRYDLALAYNQKELAIRLNFQGDNVPEVALLYINIADIYRRQMDFKSALKMYQMAENIKINLYGKYHPELIKIYQSMAKVYKKLHSHDQATVMKLKSREIEGRLKRISKVNPSIRQSSLANGGNYLASNKIYLLLTKIE